ncbi:MAG TPA: acyl-CoA dehydrogenase family protein [Myxococcota bacterium]|jgi:alkylation response protein AidB-like acyl-CoA dehydrogenase
MDFTLGEEHVLVRDLAREILARETTPELLKALEAEGAAYSPALWSQLAAANLTGIAVPEALGGMGLTLLELCALLQETGRAVAPVPTLTLALAGLPLARAGTPAQRERWLPALARGEAILSAALVDAGSADPAAPATRARREGAGFRLDGEKLDVPVADAAQLVLVPAATDAGPRVFLVDPHAPGVRIERRLGSGRRPSFNLSLASAAAQDVLGGEGFDAGELLRWLDDVALVAIAALQVGVSERALEITASYVKQRVQFGAPIGSFTAVQHRCADAWIDLEALRWTTWRAAWKLASGEDAHREALVAKFWAADAGARIATATQHLHGGMGVDLDYPVHRHFLWSKALELEHGGASPQLVRLGRDLARSGPQELR